MKLCANYIKGSKEEILFQSKQGKENVASDPMLHLTCSFQTVYEAALNYSELFANSHDSQPDFLVLTSLLCCGLLQLILAHC